MGRPLNKKYFGEPSGDANKIVIAMWDDTLPGVDDGWIVEQVATGEFIVTNGTVTDRVELQASLPTAPGEGAIEVTIFGGGNEYAKNVSAHRVKTFEGGDYSWSLEAATEAGQADLPLA